LKRFEFLEHTADVIVRAYGDNLEEAFAAAGEAMFALITDRSAIKLTDEITIEIESPDREGLLVAFLSKLILIHEVDQMIFREFTVTFHSSTQLSAIGRGEHFVETRHESGLHVKAASYHMIEIADKVGEMPAYVQVLFDV